MLSTPRLRARAALLLLWAESVAGGRGVAVVTGGTGGIGLATARLLAARGSDLVLAYGADDARAATAAEELQSAHGVRVVTVGGDLTTDAGRETTVASVFAAVDGELDGRVASFVHAAGFFHEGLLSTHLDGSMQDAFAMYDEYQSIYPKALVAFAEECIPRMADGEGRIVAVSNPGCNTMQIPRVNYDMPGQAKATMEWLVRMYALRLAGRGLCVNAVSPGYTDTKEWDKARLGMGRGDMEVGRKLLDEKMLSRSPMRRWADASEIAQTIAYLAAEQTGLITGAFIPVDGGLHLT